MKIAPTEMGGFQEILERRAAELVQVLRKRDGIAIEKSADQMDEIQYATERDLAIRNVDRESNLLRDVKAALRRIHDGSFGTCIECESAISPKRLAAVPWASRCIQCQEAADRDRQEGTDVWERLFSTRRERAVLALARRGTAGDSTERAGKGGCSCENRVQPSNHRVSWQLPAAQMRHCHVYIRPAWGGGGAASPKPVLRGGGQ